MTTPNVRMLADVTEKVLTHLDKNLTVDSFLDQTVHAHEHGVA
jgi:hypothetical protein